RVCWSRECSEVAKRVYSLLRGVASHGTVLVRELAAPFARAGGRGSGGRSCPPVNSRPAACTLTVTYGDIGRNSRIALTGLAVFGSGLARATWSAPAGHRGPARPPHRRASPPRPG